MYPYTMTQWLFLFYFYCFLGWCVEATYVSLKEKPPHWINRGFIRGPFLPLYGSGAIMMLVVSAPFQHNICGRLSRGDGTGIYNRCCDGSAF